MTVWEDTIVRLEAWELLIAATDGARRWSQAVHGEDRGGVPVELEKNVAGTCGEIAVAKWLGRYWTGGAGRGVGDVGGIEVRTRRSDPRDERPLLLIQPYDEQRRRDVPFVLVVGQRAEYRLVGWTTPRRARELCALGGASVIDPGNRGRPCIGVPQLALNPLDEFRATAIAALEGAEA